MIIILWVITAFVILCIGLLIGIILQRNKIPGLVKRSIIDIFMSVIGQKRFNYELKVNPSLLEVFGEPIEIFDPKTESYIGSTKPEKSIMEVSEFLSYRYYWHFKEISDYLISDEAKKEALGLRKDFWTVKNDSIASYHEAIESKREFLKRSLGLKDLPPNGRIIVYSFLFRP